MTKYQEIYAIVKQIPRGTVASYGRIARMVNCTARQVGYALHATPPDQNIPWHRVINSKGEISTRNRTRNRTRSGSDSRTQSDAETRQRQKLTAEGILFDRNGRIDLDRFGWRTD